MFDGKWRVCPENGGTIVTAKDTTSEDWLECPAFKHVCSEDEIIERMRRRENRLEGDSSYIDTNSIL
ncbi:unnamed protein product [Schistosoma turkestanicum]|nr:unnamed protein product [Schistosoma turkestanicum]